MVLVYRSLPSRILEIGADLGLHLLQGAVAHASLVGVVEPLDGRASLTGGTFLVAFREQILLADAARFRLGVHELRADQILQNGATGVVERLKCLRVLDLDRGIQLFLGDRQLADLGHTLSPAGADLASDSLAASAQAVSATHDRATPSTRAKSMLLLLGIISNEPP